MLVSPYAMELVESYLAVPPLFWGETDMPDYQKPLPHVNLESLLFWEGAKNHELLIQKCRDCGKLYFYPRSISNRLRSRSMRFWR